MTLRQSQILEALLAVEESRTPPGAVGFGAHPDEVRRELTAIRPSPVSETMIRRELRALAGVGYVRETRRRVGAHGGIRVLFRLTEGGRVKARDLAAGRVELRRAHARGLTR